MKYLLERALVNYNDKERIEYESTLESNFTECNTLDELKNNIYIKDDVEYFIYCVDDDFKVIDYSICCDENDEKDYDENYLQDHEIGGIAINRYISEASKEFKEIESEVSRIIEDYENEYEENYSKDELKKLVKDYLMNIKNVKIDDYILELNNNIIYLLTDDLIQDTLSYEYYAKKLFNEYVNCELLRCKKILEERYE